jgi:hypothetical protein
MNIRRIRQLADALQRLRETITDQEELRQAVIELKRRFDAGEEI